MKKSHCLMNAAMRWTGCDDDMSDDEITEAIICKILPHIRANNDEAEAFAAIYAVAKEIERRTLERAAAACDERAKAARVFCKARNLPDYIAVEAEGLGRTIRALGAK